MNEEARTRQRDYNRRFIERHPDYHKQRLNKKYREDEEYRERTKWLQKKNYYKRMGVKYEQYTFQQHELIEHFKDYVFDLEELKITKQGDKYIFEVKTKL